MATPATAAPVSLFGVACDLPLAVECVDDETMFDENDDKVEFVEVVCVD